MASTLHIKYCFNRTSFSEIIVYSLAVLERLINMAVNIATTIPQLARPTCLLTQQQLHEEASSMISYFHPSELAADQQCGTLALSCEKYIEKTGIWQAEKT
jgi:hypothetical protein